MNRRLGARARGLLIPGLAGLLVLCVTAAPGSGQGLNGDLTYSSSVESCAKTCHPQHYADWLSHGHSRKLAGGTLLSIALGTNFGLSGNAPMDGFVLPNHDNDVYNWDNILFVVGGTKHWKSRYVDLTGHFITKNGQNQYNWQDGSFSDYHKDEVKPYSCGACHTTGYNPNGTAFAALPGIVGDWAHFNVTCEACHGPGVKHMQTQSKADIVIDRTAAGCGQCHTRGTDPKVIIAKGGFIRHHEQYPEFLNSPHAPKGYTCVTCHNPHVTRAKGIKVSFGQKEVCQRCHSTELWDYIGSKMEKAGVKCQDCHMARATKSAIANGPYEGDVRTHIFKIDSSATYTMFAQNGTQAKGALSLEFACMPCHADTSKADLAKIGTNGKAYHTIGKTP